MKMVQPKRKKRHVVRDPAQLGAVVSPIRHNLLKSLASLGPCSVRELAEDVGCSQESLYYHVRALQKVGLIREHGKRPSNGRSEMLYDALADQLRSDPNQTTPQYLEAYRRAISALLRLTDRQVAAALERQAQAEARRPVSLLLRQLQVRLSAESQRDIARRIEALVDHIRDCDDPAQKTRIAYNFVSAPLD